MLRTYAKKKDFFWTTKSQKPFFFLYKRSYSQGVKIQKVRTHKGGSRKIRTIAYKGGGGFSVAYVRKKNFFFGPQNLKNLSFFLYKRSYSQGVKIQKVRTHKGGSRKIRTIAYKGGGDLILAIFVRTYYVDHPFSKSFTILLQKFKAIPSASPKSFNLNQGYPCAFHFAWWK